MPILGPPKLLLHFFRAKDSSDHRIGPESRSYTIPMHVLKKSILQAQIYFEKPNITYLLHTLVL